MNRKPQRISEITRREIIDRLLLDSEPFYGRSGLIPFLQRVWPLSQMPSRDSRFNNAEGDIWKHMVNNSDWTDSELLYERLKILQGLGDRRKWHFVMPDCGHEDGPERQLFVFSKMSVPSASSVT
jgi:AbiJ N-terminal domain 3